MKVLVTGSAGFLGSWLVEGLLQKGHDVIGVDNLRGGYEDNIVDHPRHTFFQRDILRLKSMDFVVAGCEAVYHCAALAYEGLSVFSPSLVSRNIVGGSVNVMTAAIRSGTVKRVINCSSMSRYGKGVTPFQEWHIPAPVDPYGVAKVCVEDQMTLLGKVHGVEVLHAVPHNVYGPRQCYTDPYRNVAAIMANRALRGEPLVIYGDGYQKRCFSYITDILPTLLQLLDCKAEHGEIFNVGPDAESVVSIRELATVVEEVCGTKGSMRLHYDPRPCEVQVATCSSGKIRQRFGYKSRTTLREGIESLVGYIRERGPQPFRYHLPLEIITPKTPVTWKEQLI